MRILFIGNSHTYFNDMPAIVAELAGSCGIPCEVTMIAHGGWYLAQHAEEPDVPFNIRYGHYDYVVLQEYTHPFGPAEKYFEAVRTLTGWIREAGSRSVIYMTWARKEEPEKQEELTAASRQIAEETGALLAPVGERWQQYRAEHPEVEMYWEDGAHASSEGSHFAAETIWGAIHESMAEGQAAYMRPEDPAVPQIPAGLRGRGEASDEERYPHFHDEQMAEMRELGQMMEEFILDEL